MDITINSFSNPQFNDLELTIPEGKFTLVLKGSNVDLETLCDTLSQRKNNFGKFQFNGEEINYSNYDLKPIGMINPISDLLRTIPFKEAIKTSYARHFAPCIDSNQPFAKDLELSNLYQVEYKDVKKKTKYEPLINNRKDLYEHYSHDPVRCPSKDFSDFEARFDSALKIFDGLEDISSRSLEQCSSMQAFRIDFLNHIVCEKSVILLNDTFKYDYDNERLVDHLLSEFIDICKKLNFTLVYFSSKLLEPFRKADNVIILKDNKVSKTGKF